MRLGKAAQSLAQAMAIVPGVVFQATRVALGASGQADQPPTDSIALSTSRALALWMVLAAACAAGLTMRYLPLWPGLAICMLLGLYGWHALRLHALQLHPASVVAMRYGESGVSYQFRTGQWQNGTVLDGGLINHRLTVARVRDDTGQRQVRYVVLTADRLSAQGFRELRRHMRWARLPQERDVT
jgi:hypothetical protein